MREVIRSIAAVLMTALLLSSCGSFSHGALPEAASASARAAAVAPRTDAEKQASDADVALRGILSKGLPFAAFDADMAILKTDFETTRSDALKATTAEASVRTNTEACAYASNAQGDASVVGGDESTIEGDQSTAQSTIDSAARQTDSLRNAQAALKAAYHQQGLAPSASEAPVLDLLRQGDAAIRSWKTKVAAYVAVAHQLATQAETTADAAASVVC